MSEEKQEDSSPSSSEPAPAGGGSKLPILFGLVNLLVSLGLAGYIFITFKKEQEAAKISDIHAEEGEHGGSAPAEGGGGEHGAPKEGDHGAGGSASSMLNTKKFGKIQNLEQFTINLSTSGTVAPKYARVNISFEIQSDDTEAEITSKMAQVRNTIIDLFNSKRPGDLSAPEGRNYLREEIKNAINSFLVTGKVKAVYFTNFTIGS